MLLSPLLNMLKYNRASFFCTIGKTFFDVCKNCNSWIQAHIEIELGSVIPDYKDLTFIPEGKICIYIWFVQWNKSATYRFNKISLIHRMWYYLTEFSHRHNFFFISVCKFKVLFSSSLIDLKTSKVRLHFFF